MRVSFGGPLAWWLGRSYHLIMVPGLGRKARIVSDWTMSALFPRDVAQLGQLGRPAPLAPTAAPPLGVTRAEVSTTPLPADRAGSTAQR